MNIFLSFLLSFVMFFGIGPTRQQVLSQQYQSGAWNGSTVGIIPAKVINGLLYVGGNISNYPADSSKNYYSDPIKTTEKGTWFKDDIEMSLRLDSHGQNIHTEYFASETWGCKKWAAFISEENPKYITIKIYFEDEIKNKTYLLPIDLPLDSSSDLSAGSSANLSPEAR